CRRDDRHLDRRLPAARRRRSRWARRTLEDRAVGGRRRSLPGGRGTNGEIHLGARAVRQTAVIEAGRAAPCCRCPYRYRMHAADDDERRQPLRRRRLRRCPGCTRGRLVDGDRRQSRGPRHSAPARRHGCRPRQPYPSVLRPRSRDRDRPRSRGSPPRRTRQRHRRSRTRGMIMTTTSQNQDLEAGEALPTTAAELVAARLGDDRIGIRFEDEDYTWDDFARAAIRRSHFLTAHIDRAAPPHLGILLENRPEFLFWWGGCALSGSTMVC